MEFRQQDQIQIKSQQQLEENYDLSSMKLLGKGSFGKVYKVMNKRNQKYYALKQLHIDEEKGFYAKNIIMEIDILYQINQSVEENCPYLIRLVDAFKDDKNSYSMILQLAESDLKQEFNTENKASAELCKLYLKQILQGLIVLKKKKIYHRDIKPGNILLINQGQQIVLTDFGVSRFLQQNGELTLQSETQTGTPSFMSPEILSDDGPFNIEKCDVFSLGLTILKIHLGLSTIRAFNINQKKIQEALRQVKDYNLAEILNQMLQFDVSKRPGFVQIFDFLNDTQQEEDQDEKTVVKVKETQILSEKLRKSNLEVQYSKQEIQDMKNQSYQSEQEKKNLQSGLMKEQNDQKESLVNKNQLQYPPTLKFLMDNYKSVKFTSEDELKAWNYQFMIQELQQFKSIVGFKGQFVFERLFPQQDKFIKSDCVWFYIQFGSRYGYKYAEYCYGCGYFGYFDDFEGLEEPLENSQNWELQKVEDFNQTQSQFNEIIKKICKRLDMI